MGDKEGKKKQRSASAIIRAWERLRENLVILLFFFEIGIFTVIAVLASRADVYTVVVMGNITSVAIIIALMLVVLYAIFCWFMNEAEKRQYLQ